jgi:hypothetical protein
VIVTVLVCAASVPADGVWKMTMPAGCVEASTRTLT